ncbi:MAG: hypothetical protein OXG79_09220 [Chloroflexi bacterium]|nr:hypothetical protein [Chloroflexota bacterium]
MAMADPTAIPRGSIPDVETAAALKWAWALAEDLRPHVHEWLVDVGTSFPLLAGRQLVIRFQPDRHVQAGACMEFWVEPQPADEGNG